MRRVVIAVLCVLAMVAAGLISPEAAAAQEGSGAPYYLALGDSLSVGYQPAHGGVGAGATDAGYTNDLARTLQANHPDLKFHNLGCSGETTTSMINGGTCTADPAGNSQLDQAVAFIKSYDVRYLTIDIGANDVDRCAPGGTSIDFGCVLSGIKTIATNLNTILSTLRAADGGRPISIGMTYYDPFLAAWQANFTGKLVAIASVGLLDAINATERSLYARYGFRVADVAGAFHTADFASRGWGDEPTNVATVCAWTYVCGPHDIHPNPTGYRKIANAFAAKLR